MNDEILAEIRDKFQKAFSKNQKLAAILKRISEATAGFSDTAEYSNAASDILGRILSEYIPNLDVAGLKEHIFPELLKDRYEDINRILAQVQTALDEKTGIKIAPQKAEFPAERVQQAAHSLEDATVPIETIQRRAEASAANISRSFHDDYMHENAQFRADAGLQCYINRETDGNCCEWCSTLAGRYEYDVFTMPEDIFRRHDNCGCTVTLENGRVRQNVWTKRSWEVHDTPKSPQKPIVISPEKAKELQEKNLPESLTSSEKGGIIEETSKKPITPITDRSIERVQKVEITGYSDNQCNFIQEQHKELLEYSRQNNNNKEVAFVFNSDLTNRREFTGADDRLDFGTSLYGKDLFVMHNHPRNSSYSFNDIVEFIGNDSIKTLTIVKNNGYIESLTKLSEYDRLSLLKELQRLEKNNIKTGSDNEYRKIIDKFLIKNLKGGFLQWLK